MATFEIDGLDKWKRSAVIWGLVGLLGAISSKPPLLLIGLSLLLGIVAASLSMALAARDKGRFSGIIIYALLAVLIGIGWTQDKSPKPLYFLTLGSLFIAVEAIASGLLGKRLIAKLNRKHSQLLSILESSNQKTSRRPLQAAAPRSAPTDVLQQLLNDLPEPLATEARRFAKPVILANPYRSLESLPPETSCLSGAPLLTSPQAWPQHHGAPLEFLAQIHLPDLPETDHPRPRHGLLSFFYDIDSQPWGHDASDLGACAIVYQPDTSSLSQFLKPNTGPHPPLRKPLRFHRVDAFTPSEAFEDQFRVLIETIDEETSEHLDDLHETLAESGPPEAHRVLSLPLLIQCDMDDELLTASRAYGLPEQTAWTLLLQLDSDSDLGWCWGDAGYLYFWVPTEDLTAARFDRAWVVLQCT